MGCVYLITSPSGKQYVGMTTRTLAERWAEHCAAARQGSDLLLARAIRKHEADALKVEVLHESDDQDELWALEVEEISRRSTAAPNGYNLTLGGDGMILAPEAVERLAAAVTEAHARPEVKARHSAAIKAAHARPEVKAKRRAAFSDPVVTARWKESMQGNWTSPEVCARRRAAQRAAFARPEVKKRQCAASLASNLARQPNIFADGQTFKSQRLAAEHHGIGQNGVHGRVRSGSARFRWWHTIPNHNDPECDAVEECHAIMQWAAANPDHPKVPEWARPKPDPELVALEQEIADMLAERRRRQAASSEQAAA